MSDTRFEVGSSITWLDWVSDAEDCNGNYYIAHGCLTGTILSITPQTVLVRIQTRGTTVDKRFGKQYLAHNVYDEEQNTYNWELRDIILDTIGQSEKDMIDFRQNDVYKLKDPRNQAVRYIGISKDAMKRFRQHVTCSGMNLQKNLWIIELMQLGLEPELEIIETVIGTKKAREREQYWIHYYLEQGADLLNILEGVAA